jgi:pimeloyl-ACP methyl ester carboxylesterase
MHRLTSRTCLATALAAAFVLAAAPAFALERPPLRGERVDIGGGRHLRILCEGPKTDAPLILLEGGMFSGAADWDAVQTELAAKGVRSCAYDRAGIGFSDPGPMPRDATAINADFESLLKARGEQGPYVLVAHSLGGIEARLFAERHPDQMAGLVMVDTTSASLAETPRGKMFLRSYIAFSRFAEILSALRIMPLLTPWLGDAEGLKHGPAHDEAVYFFAQRQDERFAIAETRETYTRAKETMAAGPLDPKIPVCAIVLLPELGRSLAWSPARTAEARASRYGSEIEITSGTHPELIGPKHAHDVVRAIDMVLEARRGATP